MFGDETALLSASVLRHRDLDKDISPQLVKTISRQDVGSNMPGERPSLCSFLLCFLYIVSLLAIPFSGKCPQQQDQINTCKECSNRLQMLLLFVLK